MIASHEKRLSLYEQIAAWAGVCLDPWSTRLLMQIGKNEPVSLEVLGKKLNVQPASMELALDTLSRDGLVAVEMDGHVKYQDSIRITEDGRRKYQRLVEARQHGLQQILAEWSPEQHADLAAMLNRLTATLNHDGILQPVAVKTDCG